MKFSMALKNMSLLQKIAILSVSGNFFGVVAIVMLAYGTLENKERLTLVPPYLDSKVEIAWNTASKEYIKSFGLYVASLVGNLQPKTAPFVIDSLSAFMAPAVYSDFRRQALAIVDDPIFKQAGVVITFQPTNIQYENETSRVFVVGSLITKGSRGDQQKNVTYEMTINIIEGRPIVMHFTSYEGNIPRTVNWHVNQANREGNSVPDYADPKKVREKKVDFDVNELPAINESKIEDVKSLGDAQ